MAHTSALLALNFSSLILSLCGGSFSRPFLFSEDLWNSGSFTMNKPTLPFPGPIPGASPCPAEHSTKR